MKGLALQNTVTYINYSQVAIATIDFLCDGNSRSAKKGEDAEAQKMFVSPFGVKFGCFTPQLREAHHEQEPDTRFSEQTPSFNLKYALWDFY